MGNKSGEVIPLNGPGGQNVKITLNVHHFADQKAHTTATQDEQGNMTIEVVMAQVERGVSESIYKGTSPIPNAIEKAYGLSRVPGNF